VTATEGDQVQLSAPVAAGIRGGATRAGVAFMFAGLVLAGLTVTLVLLALDGDGPLIITGGVTGGAMVILAGAVLLDARQVVFGQSFVAGRARRLQRLLRLIFLASVVIGGLCAYGAVRIADEGESVIASVVLPLVACVLTALAVVVGRSVLRPATFHR